MDITLKKPPQVLFMYRATKITTISHFSRCLISISDVDSRPVSERLRMVDGWPCGTPSLSAVCACAY